MRKILLIGAALILTACQPQTFTGDAAAVNEGLKGYQLAALDKDAERIYDFISPEMRAQQELTLERAVKLNQEQLGKIHIADQIDVLHLRALIPASELAQMTVEGVTTYRLNSALEDPEAFFMDFKVKSIEVTGDEAQIVWSRGRGKNVWFADRVGETWVLRFVESHEAYQKQVQSLYANSDQDYEGFLDQMLKSRGIETGLTPELWLAAQ